MLRVIIEKELLNNIFNLRFIFGLVLCVVVTITCVVILAHDYQQELADYNLRVNSQDEFLDNYAHRDRLYWMIGPQRPPERFRPLIVGLERNMDSESFYDNPLPILFLPLDFLFIVTIIMSLLAILFSYDSIAGERQSGTLKLMISNSLPRAKILFGKLFGGTASLLIPFILALLAGAIYISISPSIQWDGSEWTEFLLLTTASITFITLFYLLGLAVSAFSRYSATSILNCLFLWVLLILVIPNLCPYVSTQLYRIPSISEFKTRETEIERTGWYSREQCRDNLARKYKSHYGKLFSEFESIQFGGIGGGGDVKVKYRKAALQRAANDPEFKAMMDAFEDEFDKTCNPGWFSAKKKADKLWEDLETKAVVQTKLAKNLACISPFANFVYVATDLTGTGLRSSEYFEQIKSEYRGQFWSYVEKKIQDVKKNNPTFTWHSFLDVSDRPRFVFKEEPLKDKLNAVLPYWGILLFFNVLFFAIAFVGFLRYDVR